MARPILHVIPHLWSGAGAVLTRLCEAQRRSNPVVMVTAGTAGPDGDWPSYRARLRRAGVQLHTIDFFTRDQATFWTNTRRLAELIRTLRPRVIHAHAGVPAAACAVARSMAGSKTRLVGQMYSWGPNRPEWMNVQDMWGFSQCDRVVCSADAYWNLLVKHGVPERKLVYVPWGLPLDELPYRGKRAMNLDAPVVGFVGRIEPRKGQLDLVKAFARLHNRKPHARLELIGPVADPAYARAIRALIMRERLTTAVRLLGRVRDVAAAMRDWDLFVSMSSDEGQGMAVLEAMAIGVPVAARPVAGVSDFLRAGRNAMAIDRTCKLSQVLADPDLTRIVRPARRMLEQRYNAALTAAAFERVY